MYALQTPVQAAQWLRGAVTGQLHSDSRKVQQGDGFLAWPGSAHDARAYVAAALAQGASACLVEAEGFQDYPWPTSIDKQKIGIYEGLKQASGPIADAYYESPSQQLQMLAVTGTNGKTSTAWWLAHALTRLGKRCAMVGTLGMGEAHQLEATGMTTPDPVHLQAKLRQWVDAGVQACALEASSIGLSEGRLDGSHVQVAVFTNFTQDHLDYHGDMQAYWQAKLKLFDWPGLQSVVINTDDAQGQALAQQLQAKNPSGSLDIWTVSMQKNARLIAKNIVVHAKGLTFDVVESDDTLAMATSVVGNFNVLNLMGVIAALRSVGIPLSQAVDACKDLPSVPGRMQGLGSSHTPYVVVDYAHTPDAIEQVLKTLQPVAKQRGGQLICVLGCGGDRDASKRSPMAKTADEWADAIVLTSDNPRSEDPQHIINDMLKGLPTKANAHVCLDRAIAIAEAIAQAKSQDVILIAGKGHESYQEIASNRIPFSDAQHALSALKLRGLV